MSSDTSAPRIFDPTATASPRTVHHNGWTGPQEEDEDAIYLFEPSILKDIDLSKSDAKFSPQLTIDNPGENLKVRPLKLDDYDNGFLELLSHLTNVGDISPDMFIQRFNRMKACKDTYYVTVVEDTTTHQVIAAATLVVEQKFIHECALRGHLEDVVVSDTYRGKQLGKLIVSVCTLLADQLNCYKIGLDCNDPMIKFYANFGYKCEEGNANSMKRRMQK